MKKLWKKLLAASAAVLILGCVSAAALDTEALCSLTINLAEEQALPAELARAEAAVALYRVADVDDAYHYTAEPAFAALESIGGYKNVSTAEEQLAAAAEAAAVVEAGAAIAPAAEGAAVNGRVTFDALETGLYLIRIDTVEAGENRYSFNPVLVSLPTMEEEAEGVWSGADLYDVTIDTMKPGAEPLYGDLTITESLDTFSHGPATFVFLVEATMAGEEGQPAAVVYSDVASMVFTEGGSQSVAIEQKIPLGADVTVTEVYSGAGYVPAGERVQTVHLGWVLDENGQWILSEPAAEGDEGEPIMEQSGEVAFADTYAGSLITGSAIENRFTWNGESWNWQGLHDNGEVQSFE